LTSALEIHAVTPDRSADLVELFTRRGPRGGHRNSPASGCWCMYWRQRSNGNVALNSRRMGSVALFEPAGFVRVREANKRAIYRLGG
jgi:hypothetical protein